MTEEPRQIKRRKSKPLAEKIRIAISRQIFILMKKGRQLVDSKTGEPVTDEDSQPVYVQPSSADIAQAQQWLHRQPAGKEKSEVEMALDDFRQKATNDADTHGSAFKINKG